MRKTIDVWRVLELANSRLALRENDVVRNTADWRRGVADLLEAVLHEADAYAGFEYLAWRDGGHDAWVAAGCPATQVIKETYFGDQTRRGYFYHRGLNAYVARSVPGQAVDVQA